MILGFGNWIKPGSPAVTVLFADAYNGRGNALVDENVPLAAPGGSRQQNVALLTATEAAVRGQSSAGSSPPKAAAPTGSCG